MHDNASSEDDLTLEEIQALKNKRTGMFLFQMSWIMVFISLAVVNGQLRFSPEWTLPDTEKANPFLGALATVALLASAMLVRRAMAAVQANDNRQFLNQWLGAMGLGVVFMVIIIYEWRAMIPGSQYVQVFRLMTGFHLVHAGVIDGYLFRVYLNGRNHAYNAREYWAVEAGAKLWYFVFVAWMLFYIVIYWV